VEGTVKRSGRRERRCCHLLGMAIKHARQIKIGNKHKFVGRKSTVWAQFCVAGRHMNMPPSRDQVLKSKFVVDSIVIKNKKEISNDRQLLPTLFNTLSLSITLSHCVLNYLCRPDCCLVWFL